MNKNTWIVIVIFVALLGAVVLMKFWPQEQKTRTFTVASVTPTEAAQEGGENAPPKKLETTKPEDFVDTITIVRKGTEVVVKKDEEGTWTITAPIEASADKYKVGQMLEPFDGEGESVFSKEMSDEDRPYFGLDPEHAIEVELANEGKILQHIFIGATEKAEAPPSADPTTPSVTDTFVSDADNAVAYRIANKDYRKAFDKGVNELRSKKVFTFKKDDLTEIVIEDPADTVHPKVVLAGTVQEPDEEETDETPKKKKLKKKATVTWTIEQPEGYEPGNISSYASSLANLFVSEFIAPDETPEPSVSGLDDSAFRIGITAKGKTHTLLIGKEVDAKTYATIEGSSEVFTVSKYTAKNIKKGIDDLRNKKIFRTIDHKMVAKVEFLGGESPVVLEKGDDGWAFVAPEGMQPSDDEVDKAVKSIVNLMVDGYHSAVTLADAGLENAPVAFRLTATDGQVFEIKLGEEKESKRYAMVVGKDEVITLTTYSAKKLTKEASDLRRKKLFSFDKGAVTGVTIARPDETVTLKLAAPEADAKKDGAEDDSAEKKPAPAEKVWAFTVPKELTAKKVDQTKMKTLINTMATLKAKELYDAGPPAEAKFDEGLITVALTLEDGTVHTLEVSATKKDGDSYARVKGDASWGTTGFLLNAYQIKNITKKGAELVDKAKK